MHRIQLSLENPRYFNNVNEVIEFVRRHNGYIIAVLKDRIRTSSHYVTLECSKVYYETDDGREYAKTECQISFRERIDTFKDRYIIIAHIPLSKNGILVLEFSGLDELMPDVEDKYREYMSWWYQKFKDQIKVETRWDTPVYEIEIPTRIVYRVTRATLLVTFDFADSFEEFYEKLSRILSELSESWSIHGWLTRPM